VEGVTADRRSVLRVLIWRMSVENPSGPPGQLGDMTNIRIFQVVTGQQRAK
jgi:hypothetical protein